MAVDGWSFHSISKSEGTRLGLLSRKFSDLPKTPQTIKNLVMKFADDLIQEDKKRLAELVKKNIRFALTFDEWTSLRNRRYLNLVLHYEDSKIINLGLFRVIGNATSVNVLLLVQSALGEFGLDLYKHIVCIMTDGCPTMTKLGELASPVIQQLYYAHAIQLSVLDTLYVKKTQKQPKEVDTDSSDSANEEDDSGDEDENLKVRTCAEFSYKYREDLLTMVQAVRPVVKHFINSPLANEKLQSYVKKFHEHELGLLLDCKTRWSSLFKMLERFSTLHLCVEKTLNDEGKKDLIKAIDIKFFDEVVDALRPVEWLTRKLCQRDATLVTADASFSIVLKKLTCLNTLVSEQIYQSLLVRLQERRTILSDTLFYLQSAKMRRDPDSLIEMASRSTITNTLKDIIVRLKNEVRNEQVTQQPITDELLDFLNEDDTLQEPPTKTMSLEEEMDSELKREMKSFEPSNQGLSPLLQTIKKEMELFESGGSRGCNLQFVYEVLLNIKPTSVKSERVFSTSGNFCSKLRSRLGDDSLSKICYLKSYFLTNKPKN